MGVPQWALVLGGEHPLAIQVKLNSSTSTAGFGWVVLL